MKQYLILLFSFFIIQLSIAQTLLTEAENFNVKTIDGLPIWLFPILDEEEKIVVIDFFSTTCGPCQDYADDFQRSYEAFGSNTGNVYHMGINWGSDNQGVHDFDSVFGLTFPSVSGLQGGGNIVYNQYEIQSYPTVIVIKPDHLISNQYIWVPSEENIEEAIIDAGGIFVGTEENIGDEAPFSFYPSPLTEKGLISLELMKPGTVAFEVFDIFGKLMKSESQYFVSAGKHNIPLSVAQFPAGFYFIRLMKDQESVETVSFVVNR